jgi:alanine dehydrogenase
VLGGGVAGTQAARTACGLGADVTLMDVNLDRLRYLDEVMPRNCRLLYSTPLAVREALPWADVIVGAVLIPGAPAPTLVRRDDLKRIRPGSVIVDLAVDQGGCIETAKPTTHAEPVFTVEGVTHYCVVNMPGAVPRTATFALANATLPWTMQLARLGPAKAVLQSTALASSANILAGQVTHPAVARAFELEHVDPKAVAETLG